MKRKNKWKFSFRLKQEEDREEKLRDDLHEMKKPLARYEDDEDLVRLQKNAIRDDDPMLQFGRDKLEEKGLIKTGAIYFLTSFKFTTFQVKILEKENLKNNFSTQFY